MDRKAKAPKLLQRSKRPQARRPGRCDKGSGSRHSALSESAAHLGVAIETLQRNSTQRGDGRTVRDLGLSASALLGNGCAQGTVVLTVPNCALACRAMGDLERMLVEIGKGVLLRADPKTC
jgi:hypothetical protein